MNTNDCMNKGEWTMAEREFRMALQSAEEQNDDHQIRLTTHNLGLPAMMRGDFGEALRWLGRMLRNDSGDARRELNTLPPADRAAAQPWLDKADERDAALAASRQFAADAMAALAKPSL